MTTGAEIKLLACVVERSTSPTLLGMSKVVIAKALRFYAEHSPDVERDDGWQNFPVSSVSSAQFLAELAQREATSQTGDTLNRSGMSADAREQS